MSRGRVAVQALLVLAALLAVLAAASAWHGARALGARGDETANVDAAARAFVLAYGTFDPGDADAYLSVLRARSTGVLGQALADVRIDPGASTDRRSVRTDIESVTIAGLAGNRASATVVAVQQRRWLDTHSGTWLQDALRQHVSCALVQVDGRWLVDDVRVLSEEPVRPDSGR